MFPGTNRVPVEGPGELAQALDDFDVRYFFISCTF